MAVDMAKANADAAESASPLDKLAAQQAQSDLNNTMLKSPVKGVVIDRTANIGETVGPSTNEANRGRRLFLIAGDLAKMQVWMSVDEYDVARIRKIKLSHSARMPCQEKLSLGRSSKSA